MTVWLVRAGRDGEDEASCTDSSRVIIGFREVPDLTAVTDWDAIRGVVANTFPSASQNRVGNLAGQLYAFRVAMEPGDIVALPRKRVGKIALGRVKGPYEYAEVEGERRHVRPVQWLNTDVPRANFGQDLLNSMGAFLTVCEIKRNDAELRIRAVLDGKPDPGLGTPSEAPDTQPESEDAAHAVLNLESISGDQIREYVEAKFKGHELTRLIDEILVADGFFTYRSPPGPDGGVDILARKGTLGLEGQKLCVQVKSSVTACDVTIFRALQGTMQTFGADRGLLVSWGGFNKVVLAESRTHFYNIRLWDSQDVLEALLGAYERLPEALRAEIPLKRIWTMVLNE
jgi:restriction system protein